MTRKRIHERPRGSGGSGRRAEGRSGEKINAVASEADSLYEENERLRRRLISSIAQVGAIPLIQRGDWWALARADGSPCKYQKSYDMNGEVTLSNGASMKQFIEDVKGISS